MWHPGPHPSAALAKPMLASVAANRTATRVLISVSSRAKDYAVIIGSLNGAPDVMPARHGWMGFQPSADHLPDPRAQKRELCQAPRLRF